MFVHDEGATIGFPISSEARDTYQFDGQLLNANGKSNIATFHAARLFAQTMNAKRDLAAFPEQTVRASQINAMALVHGIQQYIFRMYCAQHNTIFDRAFGGLHQQLGPNPVQKTLGKSVEEFPPMDVYLQAIDPDTYLDLATGQRPNREITLEELLMVWMTNANPAFGPLLELYNDERLERGTRYTEIINELHRYFGKVAAEDRRAGVAGGMNIIDFLMAPVRAAPHSLEAQLRYIMEHWGDLAGAYMHRLLRGLDLISEEFKPVFGGPGPTYVPSFRYDRQDEQYERFSPDREWMPNLVLMAKNAYVWLDQLSKKYKRTIVRLDQVPDEELDMLARWGFTGLWLIGLWERSTASKRIKQLMGNADAVASAYSLYDYQIAHDLGGEAACDDLRRRAWQRGVRLASDMVPNHVGIDGRWVIEHPDWFISLPYSPFPGYSFNGIDLSSDDRVGVFLEDHYFDKSDAAVVFKRVDRYSGDTRYIYHGNDGTSMPWNDTAQLDYLNPEMREAMIQTILHVARQFPIIRFDAAMTLAKKHIQRLWFPEPGSGGAIPSRAEHGLTLADFDKKIPNEFWREVVDRVAQEVPDTLLLAEAFWLLEGYFVRTLGMHRVYNSAFMNMLRDEENAKYRLVIKNTQEFDPEILKRYVNFMNNPDERTAVDQFGKGGKYFGTAILMSTMPGLPMFGHGQIEGLTEKYGMEYRRAYWDEQPDQDLIARHERELFPLLRKRYLFAGVENFLLYDFYSPDGGVNEDVYAYSNAVGGERSLVVYHNRYAEARGWLHRSAAYLSKADGNLRTKTLAEGLGLPADGNQWVIFRDHTAGLEYLRNSKAIFDQGLYIEIGAYQYHVFLDFRVVPEIGGMYAELAANLNGGGVPSVDEALREIYVRPVTQPFAELVNPDMFRRLLDARVTELDEPIDETLLDEVEAKTRQFFEAAEQFLIDNEGEPDGAEGESPEVLASEVRAKLDSILRLPTLPAALGDGLTTRDPNVKQLRKAVADDAVFAGLLGWLFVHSLGELTGRDNGIEHSRSWIDEWLLGHMILHTLQALGVDSHKANQTLTAIKLSTAHQSVISPTSNVTAAELMEELLQETDMQQFLQINRYEDVLWFNAEGFDELLTWLLLPVAITDQLDLAAIERRFEIVKQLRQAGKASEFQIEKLRAALAPKRKPTTVKTKSRQMKRS